MAQPEKIRRNVGGLLGFAAIAVSVFGFTATPPTSAAGWVVQVPFPLKVPLTNY